MRNPTVSIEVKIDPVACILLAIWIFNHLT